MTGFRQATAVLFAAFALLTACSRAPEQPEPSPALWEISGPQGEHGYLFGTIHALPRGIRWHTAKLDAAFAEATVLAVEAKGLDDSARMNAIFERVATTKGLPPLASRVPANDRALVENALASRKLSDKDFADTESWAAALTLANAYELGSSEYGVDRNLLHQAKGKRVVELEGIERQLLIFDALPRSEQTDLLVAIAKDAAAGEAERRKQLDAWLTGNVSALIDTGRDPLLSDPELRQALLIGRNKNWAGEIEGLLEQGGTLFVAVGAAHVAGAEGLAALLAARGYTVTRIQ